MKKQKSSMGFTILELFLVITSMAVVGLLAIPMGIRFFQTQTLQETTSEIVGVARRAENQAMVQKNDSAFGINFLSNSYVLFQGGTYASRTTSEDETYTLAIGTTLSGLGEVVFAKRTGLPSAIGTLTITAGSDSTSININAQGKIDQQ